MKTKLRIFSRDSKRGILSTLTRFPTRCPRCPVTLPGAAADGTAPFTDLGEGERVSAWHFGDPEMEAAERKLCSVLIPSLSSLVLEAYPLLVLLDFDDGV